MNWVLTGGEVLEADAGGRRDLFIDGGWIATDPPVGARRFDAAGLVLAPGICDVHGDGFERSLSPRPGVTFPVDLALIDTDRQLVANGITTAWLALTIGWEPGLRSREMAGQVIEAVTRLRPHLGCDIRVQLRWEVFALDAVESIEAWLAQLDAPVLAFNDHLTAILNGDRGPRKVAAYAGRAGMAPDDYMDLIRRAAQRGAEVPAAIARLAAAASRAGVACFAHDETTVEARRENRAHGIAVTEFPLRTEVARDAVGAGEATVLGAPNILRGGSHIGAIDAAPAVADGLCTVLASDYFYPAQLHAVAKLDAEGVSPLAETWPLISAKAAACCGLGDRGGLVAGQRGDVVALSRSGGVVSVEAVFRGGQPVLVRDAARLAT